ncbi:unnamed protein product [Leptidea sinapis]|uniref:Chitin-binding type-2 domain-containing protein n=1 Tax=Leptidea sinapis TaxID=189913 RepID=A0A5E4QR19_9NEOP|nr:unnamed protein product [Leptidea sinapis]
MRWKRSLMALDGFQLSLCLLFTLCSVQTIDAARRTAGRRSSREGLYIPAPSTQSIQALAAAMGAAEFESYTEGKALVKRLIPPAQADIVEHQGVIGKAGVDFPALPRIPNTGFNCKNVFHICDTSRKISFLCPNGTIFSQSHLICDWWFKVDCASSPALYESSVEYYSNEQKKSQKITKSLSKTAEPQPFGIANARVTVTVPTSTERQFRSRQRQTVTPAPTSKASPRSYQALFNINPTQRSLSPSPFENRRKSLVQLISNDFGSIPIKTTLPTYFDIPTRRANPSAGDYNSIKEMQEAAETASFAENQNRQFLRDYNTKNLRPYPVYKPNLPANPIKTRSNPNLTTLYNIQSKITPETTTKRQTLVPYTKSYLSTVVEKREPYTRPGVSLLRTFLRKEKNRTQLYTPTEKFIEATPRSEIINKESTTKVPYSSNTDSTYETASTNAFEVFSTINNDITQSTEPTYQERRERLLQKINFDSFGPTQPVPPTQPNRYYGDQPNRPGLVVPPSLTPKTLHSLAIYYSTALDNLSTTQRPDTNESTTQALDAMDPIGEVLPNLFSRHTLNKYSSLFGNTANNAELLEEIMMDPNGTYNELAEDLNIQMSQTPLASSPQIRELAQVFTHALSAYLQDPVQFRKVLSDIRPTPPSFGDMYATDYFTNTEPTTTINEDDDEILGFSDDHKTKLRDGKSLKFRTDLTTTTEPTTTTQIPPVTLVTSTSTTYRNPYICCGRISASYTTASTPIAISKTPSSIDVSTIDQNQNEHTTDSYTLSKYGEFQNNTSNKVYGDSENLSYSKLLSDYTQQTNLPTAWGDDIYASTLQPISSNSHQTFESKKIKVTTPLPEATETYSPETDSSELENEEELQRAHSQSFIGPASNSLRVGKQFDIFEKNSIKTPSEDLEAPVFSYVDTTTQATNTVQQDENEIYTTTPVITNSEFTSSDTEKITQDFHWKNWQSTIVDPITLNDGLSPSGPDQDEQKSKATDYEQPTTTNYPTTEQTFSSTTNYEITTFLYKNRSGKALREQTSTEGSQDFTTMADTVVEKAKEIMGGMNSTTTQKLMNVMKKTKSKSVKRLILLLVQTCDDDHNSTAEASKKALLEALMAVSQKDMDEIKKEEENDTVAQTTDAADIDYVKATTFQRRMDRIPIENRSGKSLNFDADAINALSNPTTATVETEETETTTPSVTTTTVSTTLLRRRGAKKFTNRSIEESTTTAIDTPIAQARVATDESKGQSDTRAIELLRSLYSIAAKWG